MSYPGHRAVPAQADIKYRNLHGLNTDCLQGSQFPCLLFLASRNHLPSLAWGSFLTRCNPALSLASLLLLLWLLGPVHPCNNTRCLPVPQDHLSKSKVYLDHTCQRLSKKSHLFIHAGIRRWPSMGCFSSLTLYEHRNSPL